MKALASLGVSRQDDTSCRAGHSNTYVDKRGKLVCRECNAARKRTIRTIGRDTPNKWRAPSLRGERCRVLKTVTPDLGLSTSWPPDKVLYHSECVLHDADHYVYPVEDDGSITYHLETMRNTRQQNVINAAQYLHPGDAVKLERLVANSHSKVADAVRDALAEARMNGNMIRLSTLRRVEALVPANQITGVTDDD